MRHLHRTAVLLIVLAIGACEDAPVDPGSRSAPVLSVTAPILSSVPVQNPVDGHLHEAIAAPGINWTDARDAAAALSEGSCQGYLSSVTTADEMSFITSSFPEVVPLAGPGYWIGGYQPAGSTVADANWTWLSGEAFGPYAPWATGAPDDGGPFADQDALGLVGMSTGPFGPPEVRWDDLNQAETAPGYVVEFDSGCTLQAIVEARVDVKPGSDDGPTPVNLKSRGKITVAVLSVAPGGEDAAFDATDIDVSTVTLGDGVDPDTPVAANKHGKSMAAWADLNGDGLADAIFHFRTQDLVSAGDLDSGTTELVLRGQTSGGDPFSGSDGVDVK